MSSENPHIPAWDGAATSGAAPAPQGAEQSTAASGTAASPTTPPAFGTDGATPAPSAPAAAPAPAEAETAPTPEEMATARRIVEQIYATFGQRVVGQTGLRTSLLVALLANGHILLESVPGLAKTTAAQTLAGAVHGVFHRIQCTPDLMPNDIVGTQIYNYGSQQFQTQLGPVHANLVLLDEINRSSAKTQSAMLEAMQERQTSIGGEVYPLPKPFMVLATQNPIEEEGTYVLPEAQMDRFLLKEVLTYPTPGEEFDILERIGSGAFDVPLDEKHTVTLDDVLFMQKLTKRIYVDAAIKRYIVDIIYTTRGSGPRPVANIDQHVRVGASPRGSIALMQVAQAYALLAGRDYVTPDDVKAMRYAVLRHRIILTFDALANDIKPETVIDAVFDAVPTP